MNTPRRAASGADDTPIVVGRYDDGTPVSLPAAADRPMIIGRACTGKTPLHVLLAEGHAAPERGAR